MKLILKTAFILCLASNFSFSQDCNSIHVGKFKINDNKINLRTIIERTETEQIETNLNTVETFTGSIEWIDKCTYIFTYLKTNSKNPKYHFFVGKKMIVNITNIKGDKIFFNCSIEEIDFEMSYFMTRINKFKSMLINDLYFYHHDYL